MHNIQKVQDASDLGNNTQAEAYTAVRLGSENPKQLDIVVRKSILSAKDAGKYGGIEELTNRKLAWKAMTAKKPHATADQRALMTSLIDQLRVNLQTSHDKKPSKHDKKPSGMLAKKKKTPVKRGDPLKAPKDPSKLPLFEWFRLAPFILLVSLTYV